LASKGHSFCSNI